MLVLVAPGSRKTMVAVVAAETTMMIQNGSYTPHKIPSQITTNQANIMLKSLSSLTLVLILFLATSGCEYNLDAPVREAEVDAKQVTSAAYTSYQTHGPRLHGGRTASL